MILLLQRVILIKFFSKKHKFNPDVAKQIPSALANPMAVLRDSANEFVVVLELKDKDASVVVPVKISRQKGRNFLVNEVTSFYGKDHEDRNDTTGTAWILRRLSNHNEIVYLDRKKSSNWQDQLAPQWRPDAVAVLSSLPDNIPNEQDLVKERIAHNNRFYQANDDVVKGSVKVNRTTGEKLVSLFESADSSTFVHEMGHIILEDIIRYGKLEDAGDTARFNLQTVADFLGIQDIVLADLDNLPEDMNVRLTEAHERWADTFSLYLATGDAPSGPMHSVFTSTRRWLINLFINAEKSGVLLSPEVRGVFDTLLATPQELDAYYEERTSVGDVLREAMLLEERAMELARQEPEEDKSLDGARFKRPCCFFG